MATDLLFYEGATGEFAITLRGSLNTLWQHTDWRTTWSLIVPGNFGGGSGFTDLLFYDPTTGTGEFYRVNGAGGMTLMEQHTGWHGGWTMIVPGNFGGSGLTDLLFYDASAGIGDFYTLTGPGQIQPLRKHTGWLSTWTRIVPGNFGGSGLTDLLFYNASLGAGDFYTVEQGEMIPLRQYTGWLSTWTEIVPGNFGGSGLTDLLFYNASLGVGDFYTFEQGEMIPLAQHTGWRGSWTLIVPGNFSGGGATDLFFYDATEGTGEFYSTQQGVLSLLNRHAGLRNSWQTIVPGQFAPSKQVRLHLKVLVPPQVSVDAMVDGIRQVYVRAGLRVFIGSIETLNLPNLLDIEIGSCRSGGIGDNITGDVADLFRHRHLATTDDIVIYFVRSTNPASAGCAKYPGERAGAVVTRGAGMFVTAHEVGHILGLRHVDNRDRLMNPSDDFTNPPPNLSNGEIVRMQTNRFIKAI
jgi:hypothetical protein